MMKRVVSLAILALTAGCGTIMHGSSQDIGISSSPTGAQVSIDNFAKGSTPVIANLSRKNNHIVKIAMPGYEPAEMTLTNSVSGWVWGNIVFGGLIGLAVDAISGGLYNLNPDQLQSALAKQSAQIAPSKNGIYVILVKTVDPSWTKVGQLTRLPANSALGN
jgi:uncharacterized protein YceK